jgi:hypothetical protein
VTVSEPPLLRPCPRSSLRACRWLAVCAVFASGVVPSCDQRREQSTGPVASIRGPLATIRPASSATKNVARRLPVGPQLAILPGEGIGPIRFGATQATIERLMEAKCDAGRARSYGVFNGYIPPDPRRDRPLNVMFGMHVPGVEEALGKALRVEQAPAGNPNSTVEVHHYPGVVLEYDRIPEASVPVLGGIRVVRTSR